MGSGWNNLLLICAAGLTLAWLVAAQRRLVANAARRFLRLPRQQQFALILAVGVMTVSAQKSGTNGVFNAEILEVGRRGEKIIELSNNRIIESGSGGRVSSRAADAESAEAEASGSVVSHGDTKTRSGGEKSLAESRSGQETASSGTNSASPRLQNLRVTQITNLCATAIRPAETSVFLRAHWPVDATNVATSRLRVKKDSTNASDDECV